MRSVHVFLLFVMSLCVDVMVMAGSFDLNVSNATSRTMTDVLDEITVYERRKSRANIMVSASSWGTGSNKWWLVRCANPVVVDGTCTNFWYILNSKGVGEKAFVDEDVDLPDVDWRLVMSAVRTSKLPIEKIAKMGWMHGGRRWGIRLTTGERYDYDKLQGRMTKVKVKLIGD